MPNIPNADFGTGFGTDCEIQLTERQHVILNKLLVNGNETAKSISVQFGITQRSIEKDLSFLHKNGFIKKATKSNKSPWVVIKENRQKASGGCRFNRASEGYLVHDY